MVEETNPPTPRAVSVRFVWCTFHAQSQSVAGGVQKVAAPECPRLPLPPVGGSQGTCEVLGLLGGKLNGHMHHRSELQASRTPQRDHQIASSIMHHVHVVVEILGQRRAHPCISSAHRATQ